jgi:hypothetical protein
MNNCSQKKGRRRGRRRKRNMSQQLSLTKGAKKEGLNYTN